MHPKFAEKLALQIHLRKWKGGMKPAQLAKWITDRFPALSEEDQKQVKAFLPKKGTPK